MKKSFGKILVLALVLTFISGAALANVANVNISIDVTGKDGRGPIWEQGVIEAGGMGIVPPTAVNRAQGKALARRAAIMDAQRNLLEQTQGVQVSAESRMVDYMANDVVRTTVSGMVKGARVVLEEDRTAIDDTFIVVMQMNMYGSSGLSSVVFGTVVKPAQIQPFPPTSYRPAVSENYTGLIIVAKGMNLQPAFSPRVYDESGNIIYGNQYIDPDFAISQGMVDYSPLNVALSGSSRVGAKPLVINAIKATDHSYNLVISNEDAQKALAANVQSGGFLKRCAVVFARN